MPVKDGHCVLAVPDRRPIPGAGLHGRRAAEVGRGVSHSYNTRVHLHPVTQSSPPHKARAPSRGILGREGRVDRMEGSGALLSRHGWTSAQKCCQSCVRQCHLCALSSLKGKPAPANHASAALQGAICCGAV